MILSVQLLSLIISFFYGIFLYLMLEMWERIIYSCNNFVKILGSFLFVMFHTLLYFLILLKINNGYVHIYFLICILIGYILCKVFYKRFVKGDKV